MTNRQRAFVLLMALFCASQTIAQNSVSIPQPKEDRWAGSPILDDGSTQTITVLTSINGLSPGQITRVDFYYNTASNSFPGGATLMGSVTAEPYQVEWNSRPAVPTHDSSVWLQVQVFHTAGGTNPLITDTHMIHVDNEIPQQRPVPTVPATANNRLISVAWSPTNGLDGTSGETDGTDVAGISGHRIVVNNSPTDTLSREVTHATLPTLLFLSGDPSQPFYIHIRTADSNRNTNGENWTSTFSYGPIELDEEPPTCSITPDGGSVASNPVTFTITCADNESLVCTRDFLTQGELQVTGGTITGFTTSDEITYTVQVNPAGSGTDVTLTVPAGAFQDCAGSNNTGCSATVTYDNDPPQITNGTLSADNTYVDVTFSEAVYADTGATAPLTLADLNLIFAQNAGQATNVTMTGVTRTDGSALQGGETTVRVSVQVFGFPDGQETVEIWPANGNTVFDSADNTMAATETTGPLNLNPVPNVSVSVDVANASEASTSTVTYTYMLNKVWAASVSVESNFTGSTTFTDDFIDLASDNFDVGGTLPRAVTITFAPGQTTRTIQLRIVNDNLVEVAETLTATLQNGNGINVDPNPSNQSATHTITDDETANVTVEFVAASSDITEDGGAQSIGVRLNTSGATLGSPITVDVVDAGGGSATSGADYGAIGTQSLTFASGSTDGAIRNSSITPTPDTLIEGGETVNLRLQNLAGPGSLGSQSNHVVTVTDADSASVAFQSASSSLAEAVATHQVTAVLSTGGNTLAVAVTVQVNDQTSGSATRNADYTSTIPQILNFPIGSANGATQDAQIEVAADALAEGDETVDLRLENVSNASLAALTNHTVTITDDDDDTVSVDFAAASSSAGEAGGNHNVFLELTTGAGVTLGAPVTVRVADLLTGDAVRTQDYNDTTPQTLTFTAGAGNGAQLPYVISVTQDTFIEGDETINLRASNVVGPQAGLGAQTNHTATIADDDDDNVTVSFAGPNSAIGEADSNHNVVAQLNTPAGLTLANQVTVDVGVVGGTATSPGDYDATFPQSLTFSPGAGNGATENAVVSVNADTLIEGNETIDLRLSGITGPQAGLAGPTNHQVTIQDDDDDNVTLAFTQATSSVTEADANHNVAVQLTTTGGSTLAGQVTVQVIRTGGSATIGADYDNTFPQTLTFAAASGTGTVQNAVLGINADLFIENDETANFRLVGIVGPANLGAQSNHSTTITDDGDTSGVSVAFTTANSATPEADANHPVSVTLTAPAGHTLANSVTVNVSNVGGSATAGADYTAVSSTLTFGVGAANGANQNAQVPVLNDNLVEGDETIDLQLSAPTGPQSGLGAQTTHQVTIQDEDDDTVTLVFANPASNTPEADANHTVGVRIVMGGGLSLANPVTVDVAVVGGSAGSPADYDPTFPQTVTFPATAVNGAIQNAVVGVNDDTLIEDDETVDLRLGTPAGPQAGLGPVTNHQVTITDGGDRTGVNVSFELANSAREEATTTHVVNAILNAPAGFTLANPVTVQITDVGTGSATASGTDYSFATQTLTFPVGAANGNLQGANVDLVEDLLSEGDETINLRAGGVVGPAALANPSNHTVTITDEDTPRVSFVAGNSSTAEDGAGNNVVVQLTAPIGVSLAAPIIVDLVDLANGSATSTTDYAAIGTTALTFGIGSANGATQSVAVTPVDDTLVEGDETVNLQLQNLQGQALFGALTNHTATITDEDDDTVTVSFQLANSAVGEANVNHGVNAVLSTPAGHTLANPVTVTVTDVGGTALSGTDYTFATQVLTFAAGSGNGATETANSAIIEDTLIEGDEDIDLRLGSITGPSALAGPTNHEVTITDDDDDTVTVSFQLANSAIGEANTNHGVNAILNAPAGLTLATPVTVQITDAGSGDATATADYNFSPQFLIFPATSANGATQVANTTILADTLIEGDETIDLLMGTLIGPAALGAPTNHQVTIQDDDDDSVTVSFQLANSAVAETAGTHAVNAILNAPAGLTLANQVTVTVSDIATGTALGSGTDYSFNTQVLTFSAGAGNGDTQAANSAIVDDTLVEGDEDLDLQLGTITGPAALAGPTNHEVTIQDEDDDSVTVSFQSANSAVGEANTTHLVNAVLNAPAGHSLAVAVSVNVTDLGTGDALSGTDYTFTNSTLVFPVGSIPGSTQTASLTIIDDALVEGDETIDLRIDTLTGPAALANPTNHEVTITDDDDDNVTVSFQLANSAVAEANTTHLVNVILTAPAGLTLAGPVSVNVTDLQNGSASAGTDYTAVTPQNVVFAAGSGNGATLQATLTIFEDNLSEGNEVVNLQLDTLTGPGSLATPTNHPVTILDDDAPLVLFQLANSSVSETAGSQVVNVLLQTPAGVILGLPVTVQVSDALTGTALSGTDYGTFTTTTVTFAAGSGNGSTQQVTVTGIVDDNLVEGDETIHLDLGNLTGPAILSAPSLHEVTITDDDDDSVTVTFVSGTSMVGEANVQHPVTAVLNVPGGLTLAADVTVDIVDVASGSALSGTDYTITSPQSVTFSAGAIDGVTAVAVMQIIDDNLVETAETIDLRLVNLAGPASVGNPSNHEVTIDDDEDDFVSVTFQSANSTVGESDTTHDVLVVLTAPGGITLAAPVVVDVSDLASGTASGGTDYNAASPQTVTFAVGATTGATQTVQVSIIDDTLIEGNETVNLQLGNLGGPASIANPSNHTVTIMDDDDDFVTVTFQSTTSSVGEANTTHNVSVLLTAPGGLTLAAAVTVDVGDINSGTALSGTDYGVLAPQTVTFAIGSANGATQPAAVPIIDDTLIEGDETLNLMLSDLVGPAGIFIPSTHQVTITDDDDDAVTVTFQLTNSTVGEANVNHAVNAILNAPPGATLVAPVSVNVSDAGTGSAGSGSDYSAFAPQNLVFAVGAMTGATQVASIAILDDTLIENSETINLQLDTLAGPASIGNPSTHTVTITDDDDDSVRVQFSLANSAVTENNTIHNVNVQLITPAGFALADPIMVDVSDLLSGTALPGGTDYSASTPQTVTFAVGSGNGTVRQTQLTIVEDTLIEGDETVNVRLSNLVGPGSLGTPTNHTVTITDDDDDTVTVDFQLANSAIGEANATQNVIVVLNAPAGFVLAADVSVDVDDVRDGSATATADYNATDPQPVTFSAGAVNGATVSVSVQVLDDSLVEGDETVNLRLVNLSGPSSIGLPSNHVVTIIDEDDDNVTVSFQSSASTVAESPVQHDVTAVLSAPGLTLAVPITVNVSVIGGTAAGNADYTATSPQTLTFAVGSGHGDTKGASYIILADTRIEGPETIDLLLNSIAGPGSLTNPTTHTVTITDDDDDNVTVEFQLAATSVQEASTGHTVSLVLNAPAGLSVGNAITVSVQDMLTGSADAGASLDYFTFGNPQNVIFAPNAVNGSLSAALVFIRDDNLVEGSETVDLQIQSVTGPSAVGPQTTHQVTIEDDDDDNVFVEFLPTTSTVNESNVSHPVTAVLVAPGLTLTQPLRVDIIDRGTGTASAGSDYTIPAQTLTFPVGSGDGDTQLGSVTIFDDSVPEGNETVHAELSNVQGPGGLNGIPIHTVTIIPDNDSGPQCEDDAFTVLEGGTFTTFAGDASCIEFDGLESSLLLTDNVPAWNGLSSITIAFRLRWDGYVSGDALFMRTQENPTLFTINSNSQRIRFTVYNGIGVGGNTGSDFIETSQIGNNGTGGVFDGELRQFVFRWNNDLQTGQIWQSVGDDLMLVAEDTSWSEGLIVAPDRPLMLGRHLLGCMDEVAIYSTYEDPTQFFENGIFMSPPDKGSLLFHTNGNAVDAGAGTVADLSGNGNDMSIIGNPQPVQYSQTFTIAPGASTVLANDWDPDPFDFLTAGLDGLPSNGTVTSFESNGSLVYVHDGSETASDSFTYITTDLAGQTCTATVYVNVIPIFDEQPVCADDAFAVAEGGTIDTTGAGRLTNPPGGTSVLDNETDADASDVLSATLLTGPVNGSLTLNTNGTFVYTHNGSNTTADQFTYRVIDLGGFTCTATTFITISTECDEAPVCAGESYTVAEGGTVDGVNLLVNETDGDLPNDLLTVAAISGPTNGTITLTSLGAFTYEHDGTDTSSDSITYRVTDSCALTCEATVVITITNVCDQAPNCTGESITVNEGATFSGLNLLDNETDGDLPNDVLTVIQVAGPSNGILTLLTTGAFTYAHNDTETTSDSFSYRVTDSCGQTCDATVIIAVTPVCDQPPNCVDDSESLVEGGTAIGNVLGNDTDGDLPNDTLTVTSTPVVAPSFGTLTLTTGGSFTYTHDDSDNFSDSFQYRVTDSCGNICTATVNLTIAAMNFIRPDGPALPVRENHWVPIDIMLETPALTALMFAIDYNPGNTRSLIYNYRVERVGNVINSNARITVAEDDNDTTGTQPTRLWIGIDGNSGATSNAPDLGDAAIGAVSTPEVVLRVWLRVEVAAPLGDATPTINAATIRAWDSGGSNVSSNFSAPNAIQPVIIDTAINPLDADETGIVDTTDASILYRASLWGDLRGLVEMLPSAQRAAGLPVRVSDAEIIANYIALVDNQMGVSLNFDAAGGVAPTTDLTYFFRRILAQTAGLPASFTVPAGHSANATTVNAAIDAANVELADTFAPYFAYSTPDDNSALFVVLTSTGSIEIRYNESLRVLGGNLLSDATAAGIFNSITDDLGSVTVSYSVSADARTISITPDGDTWNGTVTIVIDQTDLFDVAGQQGAGTQTITITVP